MSFQFLNADYENVPDLVTLEEGAERRLEIAYTKGTEGEYNFITVTLRVIDEPLVARIFHTLWFPKPDDDQERRDSTLRACNRFFTAFDIVDDERMDEGIWVGKSCSAILKLTAADGEYPEKNEVKTFVTPK